MRSRDRERARGTIIYLPIEPGIIPKAKIISTFLQQTTDGEGKVGDPFQHYRRFKTNKTLCVSRLDLGPARDRHVHGSLRRSHFLRFHCVKQNWVPLSLPPLSLPIVLFPFLYCVSLSTSFRYIFLLLNDHGGHHSHILTRSNESSLELALSFSILLMLIISIIYYIL